jgi:hypothetical protein
VSAARSARRRPSEVVTFAKFSIRRRKFADRHLDPISPKFSAVLQAANHAHQTHSRRGALLNIVISDLLKETIKTIGHFFQRPKLRKKPNIFNVANNGGLRPANNFSPRYSQN